MHVLLVCHVPSGKKGIIVPIDMAHLAPVRFYLLLPVSVPSFPLYSINLSLSEWAFDMFPVFVVVALCVAPTWPFSCCWPVVRVLRFIHSHSIKCFVSFDLKCRFEMKLYRQSGIVRELEKGQVDIYMYISMDFFPCSLQINLFESFPIGDTKLCSIRWHRNIWGCFIDILGRCC